MTKSNRPIPKLDRPQPVKPLAVVSDDDALAYSSRHPVLHRVVLSPAGGLIRVGMSPNHRPTSR